MENISNTKTDQMIKEYEKMHGILDAETSGNVSLEDFVKRHEAIYKGIEIRSLEISAVEYDEERMAVSSILSLY